MTSPACLISTDLTACRVIGDGVREAWTAPPISDDQPESTASIRARIESCAAWVASVPAVRRRLSLVCLDVDESECRWIRAGALDPALLSASLRSAGEDWGDRLLTGAVQPLARTGSAPAEPAAARPGAGGVMGIVQRLNRPLGGPGSKAPLSTAAVAIINAPDAAPRLWLDALDARAIRADLVCSLWHAMAAAWCRDAEPTGAVIHDGPRLVWCWGREGELLVGGSASLEGEASFDGECRALHRVSLDWLTWSTELGTPPTRLAVLGPASRALADALARRWPEARWEPHDDGAPIDTTVKRAAERLGSADARRPGRSLVGLSTRPNRAGRTQYLWAAAAILLFAGAVGVLGYRLNQRAGELLALAAQSRAAATERLAELGDPSIERAPNPVKLLESILVQRSDTGRIKIPPAPRPLFEETQRIADALAAFEGVRLIELNLDRANASMKVKTPDRRTGEAIGVALAQSTGPIAWTVRTQMTSDEQLVVDGAWRN